MKRLAALAVALAGSAAWAGTDASPAVPAGAPSDASAQGRIDEIVLARLDSLGIQPAGPCTDAVFVRRTYLDVIGTLPTAEEAARFLMDRRPEKRRLLIEDLLARKEFAVYWAMKWSDLLRVKAEFPINLWPNAVQAYYTWIWETLERNRPYDRFVRDQLTASGSNFRVPPVNFYRAAESTEPETLVKVVALTFMGTRAEAWQPERRAGMAKFFAYVGFKPTREWKEEIVYFDFLKAGQDAAEGTAMEAVFPDGHRVRLGPDRDPRQVFADWLVAPENPWFTRSIANRVWYWLVGRGIVREPDDFRPDNPPVSPELLDFLAAELVEAKYDLKHLYRLILNSRTYQLSSVPRSDHPAAEANFACYPVRRLEAEVLIDALCQITGTTESYSSRVPEPFTWVPEESRTIALPDGTITSPFLEMFGRPPRDTGLASERDNSPTAAQRLHMLNSTHILGKINTSRKLDALMTITGGDLEGPATKLYLAILSRYPTEEELQRVQEYSKGEQTQGRNALVDLAWALINSAEFLYRH